MGERAGHVFEAEQGSETCGHVMPGGHVCGQLQDSIFHDDSETFRRFVAGIESGAWST